MEGVGVLVDPLAFAELLGMVVTSLNLLPYGRLEGGWIAQAVFERSTATLLSFATSLCVFGLICFLILFLNGGGTFYKDRIYYRNLVETMYYFYNFVIYYNT